MTRSVIWETTPSPSAVPSKGFSLFPASRNAFTPENIFAMIPSFMEGLLRLPRSWQRVTQDDSSYQKGFAAINTNTGRLEGRLLHRASWTQSVPRPVLLHGMETPSTASCPISIHQCLTFGIRLSRKNLISGGNAPHRSVILYYGIGNTFIQKTKEYCLKHLALFFVLEV